MKKIILFIGGLIAGAIVGGATVYYYLINLNKENNETLYLKSYENILPDSVKFEIDDNIVAGKATNFKITIIKNGEKMNNYTGSIQITIMDENGYYIKNTEYSIKNNGIYTFKPSDHGFKNFEEGLIINNIGTYHIKIQDLNENKDKILGSFIINVINNPDSLSVIFGPQPNNTTVEIIDSEQNLDDDNLSRILENNITNETSSGNTIPINIYYPRYNSNIMGNIVQILASCKGSPNSYARIYIDNKPIGLAETNGNGNIDYTTFIDEGEHILKIEILDIEGNIIGTSDEIKFNVNEKNLEINQSLDYDNYGSTVSPDSAKISVRDEIMAGESTNLRVDIMKNDSKITNYKGTIRILITDENGNKISENDYTVPNRGLYTFQTSDLGTKTFQRGLTINKEGKFYIEIQDLNENEDKILGKQLITVVK